MTLLTADTYPAPSFSYRSVPAEKSGLHRLFAAAIVSDQFRKTLLREPERALATGYLGQTFALTDHERSIIQSVRAENLTDFAQKVNRALKKA